MKRTLSSILATTLALLTLHLVPHAMEKEYYPYLITAKSLGPVRVGMTIDEATKALGPGWAYRGMENDDDPGCGHIMRQGLWGEIAPAFMAQNGVVTRIEIGEGDTSM